MQYSALSDTTNDVGSTVRSASGRLSSRQLAILIAFGLVFWLVAALFIRLAPLGLFDGDVGTMMLFAITVPVAWLSVQAAKGIASLAPEQLLSGLAVASAAAMLCDGIGLLWSPVYGDGDRLPGAAWVLWGVGLTLFAALFEARRQGS